MPFGAAQSLTNDELYAITAYVLYLNDVIKDFNFELSDKNFATIRLPNERNFVDDDRETAEKEFWQKNPCMKNCATRRCEDHRAGAGDRRHAGQRQARSPNRLRWAARHFVLVVAALLVAGLGAKYSGRRGQGVR